jgi:serine phosphatase RsbU (regulator of sigma subunit)/anti-sigma regulatory factor (Ser/Thr protein kinase)
MSASPAQPARRLSLRLLLACDLIEVRPASLTLRGFLSEQGIPEEELLPCELALTEACNNAIQCASPAGRRLPVAVEAICDDLWIEFRVEDHTPGFAWPEAVALPDPERESGRGLFLIEAVMDEVAYLVGRGGNCLVMRRRRRARRGGGLPEDSTDLLRLRRKVEEDDRIIRDMANELSSCYESLAAIFRYSAEAERTANIQDFSGRLLEDLIRITGAAWYVFRLLADEESRLTVFAASEPTLYLDPLPAGPGDVQTTAAESRAIIGRRDVWFDTPGGLRPEDPLAVAKPGAVGLVHPVFFGETGVGTLAVGGSASTLTFTAAKISVIHTFADFLAIQIVNARLHQERVSGLLVNRELEIARHIQQSLLLKTLPELPGFELAGYCESASQVGGDFFDVVRLTDTSFLLMISDVMGKGIPAAMFAVLLRSLVRALRDLAPRPAQLLAQVNTLLFQELSEVEMFITAQLVHVDLPRRRLTIANAGHCPLLMATADGAGAWTVSPDGMPLGVMVDAEFREETVTLDRDSRVLLYTDGISEAETVDGELIGQELLVEWLKHSSSARRTAAQMKEDLVAELRQCQGNQPLKDDQTFLILAG